MNASRRSLLLRAGLLLAALGVLVGASGCQSLRMPWASNSGLPPQSEPKVTSDAE